MTVGVWLLAVGLCDLLRAARDATSPARRGVLVLLGLALLAFAGVALQLPPGGWATVGLLWAAGLVAWVLTSAQALARDGRHRGAWRAAAFASFLVPVVLLVPLGDRPVTVAPSWLAGLPLVQRHGLGTVVLVVGVLLLQVSTANLLVRLLLDAVGVPAGDNEKTLRGGRVLGPMERLFIVTLSLAGQVTAAAVVVAAKGLLRWPELRERDRDGGPSDVSEYFLIGSFASWLLALGGWALVAVL